MEMTARALSRARHSRVRDEYHNKKNLRQNAGDLKFPFDFAFVFISRNEDRDKTAKLIVVSFLLKVKHSYRIYKLLFKAFQDSFPERLR